MAVTARWYAKGVQHFMGGDINWTTATLKVSLQTSSYTPNTETDEFQSVLSNEVAAGGGYTDGGIALTAIAEAIVDDAAVAAWTVATTYAVGDLVRKVAADGNIHRCIVAGTSHAATEPTWPTTVGANVVDNTVTWDLVGTQYVKLDAADVSWTPSTTISAAYAVIYVDGSDGTLDFVIGYVDFGGTEASSNGDFDINWHSTGVLQAFISL